LTAASPASPWADAGVQDLAAMHDIIPDNHPGPVDTQNPGFRDWLDGGEAALLPLAGAAHSLHDYQTVMRAKLAWPGGYMNDASIVRWIDTLHQSAFVLGAKPFIARRPAPARCLPGMFISRQPPLHA
jgi:hypothetical protein